MKRKVGFFDYYLNHFRPKFRGNTVGHCYWCKRKKA